MSSKKYFSVEEANSLVPRLLEIVPDLQEMYVRMKREFPDVRKAWKKARYNGGSHQGTDYLRLVLLSNRIQRELDSMGALVKGVENGLVDFPALRDGREVCLCWKLPEKDIRFWHEVDGGYAGRQPL
ncbi:MAG: DUF2203 domain-containing protein [Nitrospinaceae bacterium]